MPMTLKGALKDDELAMNRGYFQLLPETDTAGRAIIYIDWSNHEPSLGYTEGSMVRLGGCGFCFISPLESILTSCSLPLFVLIHIRSIECFGT
jgi:hypothetical protein